MSPVALRYQGCTVSATKDFCYFSSLKSKERPIQKAFIYLHFYEARQTHYQGSYFKYCKASSNTTSAFCVASKRLIRSGSACHKVS
ncbi:hypothetical protein EAH57_00885 [Acinetobacter sp. 2JN-4]|nr:hypothetical protein EAH57_00885 [Acinetobacter sp. 2JN-4]